MTNNVVKWWDGINKSTAAAQKKQHKQQEAANKRAQKEWNDFWKGVGKGWDGFLRPLTVGESHFQQRGLKFGIQLAKQRLLSGRIL